LHTNWHRTRRFPKFYGQTGPILSNKKREKSMPLGAVFIALLSDENNFIMNIACSVRG
jgi:hypothetical protein